MADKPTSNGEPGAVRMVLMLTTSGSALAKIKKRSKSFKSFDVERQPTKTVPLRLHHAKYGGHIDVHGGGPGLLVCDVVSGRSEEPSQLASSFVGVLLRHFGFDIFSLTLTPMQ